MIRFKYQSRSRHPPFPWSWSQNLNLENFDFSLSLKNETMEILVFTSPSYARVVVMSLVPNKHLRNTLETTMKHPLKHSWNTIESQTHKICLYYPWGTHETRLKLFQGCFMVVSRVFHWCYPSIPRPCLFHRLTKYFSDKNLFIQKKI